MGPPAASSSPGRRTLAVVIPTYNRANHVVRAVESVLAQSRRPDEVIVVDDGSTDDTREHLERFGADITYLEKANGGVSSARNLGVAAGQSELVAFLDSDDVWRDDHLQRMDNAVDATDAQAGLYFSDLELAPARGGGSKWQQAGFAIARDVDLRPEGAPWAFLAFQPMTIQASVVRRSTYLEVGGCDESLRTREDTLLFFKLALAAPVCAVRGIAGLLGGDDEHSLSVEFSSGHVVYLECTVRLYDELLAGRLTPEQRGIVARRLANAHWSLARATAGRSPASAIGHLAQAIRIDPAVVPRRLSGLAARVGHGTHRGSAPDQTPSPGHE